MSNRRLAAALTLCLAWLPVWNHIASAQTPGVSTMAGYPAISASPVVTYPTAAAPTAPTSTWATAPAAATDPSYVDTNVYLTGPTASGPLLADPTAGDCWTWQVLPEGLIYRSYQAGVHEPRMALVLFGERDGRSLWDATLGGRVGVWRYGTRDPLHPQGWEIDFEGAAMPRLTLDSIRDLQTVDFRAGVPITYGVDKWQFKTGYYHLSSHLGDEYIISHPGSINSRLNYVRDSLVLGASYFPSPSLRLYSEAGYAFNATGGAEPWEFQLGTEYSQPGPTGGRGTPFVAINGHLLEEHDFGGSISTQVGWLWRGQTGQVMRLGLHYYNGKSSQYQTFDDSEQQVGFGLWYDF